MKAIEWLIEKSRRNSDGGGTFIATIPQRMYYEIWDTVEKTEWPAPPVVDYKGKYLNWTDGERWFELYKVSYLYNKALYDRNRVHIHFEWGPMKAE